MYNLYLTENIVLSHYKDHSVSAGYCGGGEICFFLCEFWGTDTYRAGQKAV